MKFAEKSIPITSSNSLANSKVERPTEHPKSKALAVLIFLIYGFNNSTEFTQKFLIPKFSLP